MGSDGLAVLFILFVVFRDLQIGFIFDEGGLFVGGIVFLHDCGDLRRIFELVGFEQVNSRLEILIDVERGLSIFEAWIDIECERFFIEVLIDVG